MPNEAGGEASGRSALPVRETQKVCDLHFQRAAEQRKGSRSP